MTPRASRSPAALLLAATAVAAISIAPSAQCTEGQKLTSSDAGVQDYFATRLDLDGDRAIFGAYAHDVGGLDDAGAAYVYERSGETWTETAKLLPTVPIDNEFFGYDVAIDGDWALVGAFWNGVVEFGAGAVYAFEYDPPTGAWIQRQVLYPSNGTFAGHFGISVDLDADWAIVGESGTDQGPLSDVGSVTFFQLQGGTWVERQAFAGDDDGGCLGCSVDLDGPVAVAGAPFQNAGFFGEAGAAWVFELEGGVWQAPQELTAVPATSGEWFGDAVAVSGDTVVVGAPLDAFPSPDSGAVHVFRKGGSWVHQEVLRPAATAGGDHFGGAVALDGDLLAVGAWTAIHDTLPGERGLVHLFRRQGSAFVDETRLRASDPGYIDRFGRSVGLDDGRVLAGAYLEDGAALNAGAAYAFDLGALRLEASEACPAPGAPFELTAGCGLAGDVVGVWVVAVGGAPFLLALGVGAFDADGVFEYATPAPDLVGATPVTFLALGFDHGGQLSVAPVLDVKF